MAHEVAVRYRLAHRTLHPLRTSGVRTYACIDLLSRASYSAAWKPRGGSGTVSASARRALPLKRRSG